MKKVVKYKVDQTLRNTFPALEVAGEAEKTSDGFAHEVVIFGFESCPYCKKVEKLLEDNRIFYKDMDVEKSKTAR